jgi:hypothetical protein
VALRSTSKINNIMSRNHTLHCVCRTHGSHSKLGNRGAGVESKPAPRAELPHLLRGDVHGDDAINAKDSRS